MSATSCKRLLWIDDEIANLGTYVCSLREHGFDVVTAKDYQEALKQFAEFDPAVVLVDIRMPRPDGIEILKRLHRVNTAKTFAVLSSFLYLHSYRDQLAKLKFPVQLIDKDFPNIHNPTFKTRFIAPIKSLFECGVTYTVQSVSQAGRPLGDESPFDIEFSRFMVLPITEKDALTDAAEKLAAKTLENAFRQGYVWVLLCGDQSEMADAVDDFQRVPPDEEILRFAQKMNRAPFQFSIGFATEDHWTSCSSLVSMKDYPTVSFLIGGEEVQLHFDTGCPFSYLSYEEFAGSGLIDRVSHFIKEIRAGFAPYRVASVRDLVLLIKSQRTGETERVVVNGKAIREWERSSYARKCSENCPRAGGHTPGNLCPLRKALIGRNLLTDNKLALTLDGASRTTYFSGESSTHKER